LGFGVWGLGLELLRERKIEGGSKVNFAEKMEESISLVYLCDIIYPRHVITGNFGTQSFVSWYKWYVLTWRDAAPRPFHVRSEYKNSDQGPKLKSDLHLKFRQVTWRGFNKMLDPERERVIFCSHKCSVLAESNSVCSARCLALSQTIWSHQFGETGLFSAPKLTGLYRTPRALTGE
jgi:hypothetical protein